MSIPPSGTVTFLFTDIEGSTRLARRNNAAWELARARHHAIVQAAIEAYGGYVFQVIGDAFCAAFATAPAAASAALAAQHGLQTEQWGNTPVRVRMGLHTGAAEAHAGQYRGYLTLAHVQRVMALAHGGQVLLSESTAQLLREDAFSREDTSVPLRALGEVRLKDSPTAENVYQLLAPGLAADFPPLSAASTTPNNLPEQLTSFIGRERELIELQQLLPTTRLLTITGSGGVGKTRLSLQLARTLLPEYSDGVWLVELAPLADPGLIAQTTASAFGLGEQPGQPLRDMLFEYLRTRTILLILDNCEHLIGEVAAWVDALLHAAPRLRVVASSREPLGIAGELTWRAPSLEVPMLDGGPRPGGAKGRWTAAGGRTTDDGDRPAELLSYAAVRLFVERASFANAAFRLNESNASLVAQICQRLDGIPLAIELAAARVKAMGIEQIAMRLDDRFRLLTGGSRTALPRQQTLRGMIDWSHSLLSELERVLLRRLSVFAGGWTIEAAEAVCSSQSPVTSSNSLTVGQTANLDTDDWLLATDILDLLTRLVEKSLVVLDEQSTEPRYRMLETIRQYAREKLLAANEAESGRERHAAFFLQFAETAEGQLHGANQKVWFEKVESDLDNIRTALEWSLHGADANVGMRILNALWVFYQTRSYQHEAVRAWLGLLKRTDGEQHTAVRTRALIRTAFFQWLLGNLPEAADIGNQSLQLARALGDPMVTAEVLNYLAQITSAQGDAAAAFALTQEALTLARRLDDQYKIAVTLGGMGEIALLLGEYEKGQHACEEGIQVLTALGEVSVRALLHRVLGFALLHQHFESEGALQFRESLIFNLAMEEKSGTACALAAMASSAQVRGDFVRAVQLSGAAQSLLETTSSRRMSSAAERLEFEHTVEALRAQLSESDFAAHWAAGARLTLEQVVTLALKEPHG